MPAPLATRQDVFEALVDAGHLVPTGAPGIHGRGAVFEDIRHRLESLVRSLGSREGAEIVAFPPLLPRRRIEEIGYLKSFPHLLGTVFAFEGDDAQAAEQEAVAASHGDWSGFQQMTDLVLLPAGCYPVYPAIAARGPVPDAGISVDIGSAYVFRREPSDDPTRMQMFHMHELVRLGSPDSVAEWRDTWRDRAVDLLQSLGLEPKYDVASDPFFGRTGRMLAANQREQALKFEVNVEIADASVAVASFNYHRDHFSSAFGLETVSGERAHTACLGFGQERLILALFARHGLDPEHWPAAVRSVLW